MNMLRQKQRKQALLAHLKNCGVILSHATTPEEKQKAIATLFRQLAGESDPKMNPPVFDEDVTKELLVLVQFLEQ